ncbi:MAG: hypothetical protein IJ193_00165 [Bacilli bacterium]|nr:hypothetical protein [Bacilli bacterium]
MARTIPIERLRWTPILDVGTIIDNHKTTFKVVKRYYNSFNVVNKGKYLYDIVCEDPFKIYEKISAVDFMESVSNNILRYDYDADETFQDERYLIKRRIFTKYHPDYPPTALFIVFDRKECVSHILTGREVNRLSKYKDINLKKIELREKIMKHEKFI